MAPGIPSVQVFLGEETAGIDGAVTWVDITAYVRLESGINTSRGQSYGGGAQPGSASLTLDNTDGRFTVGNASSPLYPYFRLQSPMKLLRDGLPWFIGRIMAAPLQWPTGGDAIATVTVTLADKLARYERMTLRSFPVEEISSISPINTTGPVAYWPLGEPAGSASAAQIMSAYGNTGPLVPAPSGDATVAFGASVGISSGFQLTANTGSALLRSTFDRNTQVGDPTLGFAITATFASTTGGMIARIYSPLAGAGAFGLLPGYISVSLESRLGVPGIMFREYFATDPSADFFQFAPASLLDGKVHNIVVGYYTGLGGVYVYADGVNIGGLNTISGTGRSWYMNGGTVTVGGGSATRLDATSQFTGTLCHLAIWSDNVSSNAAQINGAVQGTTVLTTNAAFLKVLGWRGQASTALIDAGVTNGIPSTPLGSASLASVLYALNSSEAGTLYVDEQDRLTWRNRRVLPSPAIGLGPDDIDTGTTYNCDLTRVQTLVTCSYNSGSVSVKAADYGTIGEISGSVSSLTTNADDAYQHAGWVANTGPRDPYIGSLKIDMATATSATYTAVESGGILTKVTLTGMPAQTPPNSTVLEVIGEAESITSTSWDVTWTVLPAGTGSARDVFTLDSATLGVLDSTHRIAY